MNIDKLKELHKRDEIKILGKEYIITSILDMCTDFRDHRIIGKDYYLIDINDMFGIGLDPTHVLSIKEHPKLEILLEKIQYSQIHGLVINIPPGLKSMIKLGFMKEKKDVKRLNEQDISIKQKYNNHNSNENYYIMDFT